MQFKVSFSDGSSLIVRASSETAARLRALMDHAATADAAGADRPRGMPSFASRFDKRPVVVACERLTAVMPRRP